MTQFIMIFSYCNAFRSVYVQKAVIKWIVRLFDKNYCCCPCRRQAKKCANRAHSQIKLVSMVELMSLLTPCIHFSIYIRIRFHYIFLFWFEFRLNQNILFLSPFVSNSVFICFWVCWTALKHMSHTPNHHSDSLTMMWVNAKAICGAQM